jgi:hypothetical protein
MATKGLTIRSDVKRRRRAGMTLVELITAMMVSVLLIGTAFATFWSSTQAWEKAKRRTEMLRLLEGTADVIIRHLRSIEPPFMEYNSTFVAIDDSDDLASYDSMTFLSSANARFPRQLAFSDLCEIEFFLESGITDEMTAEAVDASDLAPGLYMRIDPTPDDELETGGYLVPLGEIVTSFDIRYFDGYEWVEEWYFESEVPEAVEFSITVADPLERENPMTLTRLVVISNAEQINGGAYGTTDQTDQGTEGTTGGESGGETPEPSGEGISTI